MKAKRLIALLTAIAAAGNASATTIAAAETAAAASTQTIYGDANLDGKINVSDAVAVLQFIANQMKYALGDQGKINADLIDPGQGITGLDAVAIQMIDAQLIKPEDLPMTADELKNGKKTDKPSDTPEPTQEQLELMKKNPLIVIDSETNKPFIYGDLNGDMKLDDKDLTLLNKLITDEAKYNPVADLDGDGAVDIYDAEWLEDYINKETASFPAYEKYDSDGDRLSDYAETEELKTDRMNRDTDGDGLSDLEELYMTGTDPLKKFSVSETVADSDLDPDEDGLTNIEEVKVNSDPNNKDTDRDGFDDGYEVNTLKTSPVMTDTDEDGLSDWEEVVDMKEFNLDPTKKATNGTPDNQRTFKQTIAADDPALSEINTKDNGYKLSLELTASGCAKNHIIVRNSRYTDYMKNGAAMGAVPEIIYDDDLVLTDITLKFEIDEAFRESVLELFTDTYNDIGTDEYDGIKRLNLFKYFEVIDEEMPIDTFYDEPNNIVYVTLTSDIFEECDAVEGINVGSYSLVDLEVWGYLMNQYFEDEPEEEVTEEEVTEENVSETIVDLQEFMTSEENVKIGSDNNSGSSYSSKVISNIMKNYISYSENNLIDSSDNVKFFSQFGHIYAYSVKNDFETKGGHLMTVDSMLEYESIVKKILTEVQEVKGVGFDFSKKMVNWEEYSKSKNPSTNNWRNYMVSQHEDSIYDIISGKKPNNISTTAILMNYDHKNGEVCIIWEWDSLNAYLNGIKDSKNKTKIKSKLGKLLLKGPLSKDSGIDSDNDGIADYDELNFKLLNFVHKNGSINGTASWSQILNAISDKYKRYITSGNLNTKVNGSAKKTSKNPKETTVPFIGADAYQFLGDPTQADEDHDYLTGEDDKDNPRGFDPTPVDARIIDDSNMFSNRDKRLKHLIKEYDKNEQQIAPAGTILTQANHPGNGRAAVKTLGNSELGDEVEKIEISYKRESYYNRNEGTSFSIKPTEDNDYELAIKFESKAQADIALNQENFITIADKKGKKLEEPRMYIYTDESVLICHFNTERNKTYTINIANLFNPKSIMTCTIYQDNWVYAPYGGMRVNTEKPVTGMKFQEVFISQDSMFAVFGAILDKAGLSEVSINSYFTILSEIFSKEEKDRKKSFKLIYGEEFDAKVRKSLKVGFKNPSKILDGIDKASTGTEYIVEFISATQFGEDVKSVVAEIPKASKYAKVLSLVKWPAGLALYLLDFYIEAKKSEVSDALMKGCFNICVYKYSDLFVSEPLFYSCDAWQERDGTNGHYLSRYVSTDVDAETTVTFHCEIIDFKSTNFTFDNKTKQYHN